MKTLTAILRDVDRQAKQVRFAAIGALTDTAFECRKAVQRAMPQVFDRPTPFVVSGVKVTTPQTLQKLSALTSAGGLGPGKFGADPLVAVVSIDYEGRGKGPSPEQVLTAEVRGGSRGFKGAERRLQQVGLMAPGHYMVPAADILSQTEFTDAYGNVRGSLIRNLLSYLQAFSTDGFTANTKQKKKDRIAARGKTQGGFATINGVVFFVSAGPRGSGGKQQHLPAGIWAKRGIGGSRVFPVFLFVSSPQYKVRLQFDTIVENMATRTFPGAFQSRLERAFATAR